MQTNPYTAATIYRARHARNETLLCYGTGNTSELGILLT
jgi:hypothetical protein